MKRNKNQKQREKNMSQNKINLKEKVLTCGTGSRRAVLDHEAGLVYQYDKPENILAYFEKNKGWIIRKEPYYALGGWGASSSGDGDGAHLIYNTRDLLNGISARTYQLNFEEFLTAKNYRELKSSVDKHNKLVKQQNKLAEKLGNRKIKVEEMRQIKDLTLNFMNRGKSLRGIDAVKIAQNFKNAARVFVENKGKALKVDSYKISRNLIMQNKTVVAFKDAKNQIFMNSEVLKTSDFERNFLGNQSLIQKEIRKIAKFSIPFNVLAAANLKLSETRVLEQGPESTHQVKPFLGAYQTQERHFTGALLLENSGRKFLMDIDREEIKHQIFNAFFVEVDRSVKTIAEAYESMKPEVVKQAEAKGLDVKRQGEWFFIPTDKTLTVLNQQIKSWEKQGETEVLVRSQISHGKGRPNTLYKPKGFGALDQFVCGMVEHTGREHRPLDLGSEVDQKSENKPTTFKLWQVVGNTTVGNFTITGDVD